MTKPVKPAEKKTLPRKILGWAVQVLILLVVVWGANLWQTRGHIPNSVRPPDFEILVLNPVSSNDKAAGERVLKLEDLKGKKTILFFFAPWCSVCKANLPFMDSLYRSNPNARVMAVALSYDHPDQIRDIWKKDELQLPVYLGNDSMMENYRIAAFPSIYILNSDLTVSSKMAGFSTEWGIRFRLWMAR